MRMEYQTDKTLWERTLWRPLLGVFVWSSIPAKIRGLNFRLKVRTKLRVYIIRMKNLRKSIVYSVRMKLDQNLECIVLG